MSATLYFLPDISGFTSFVHQTEVQHSKHIITELLEALIGANQLQLELAEIEGDALFFYKLISQQQPLSAIDFYKQVRKMYIAFHQQLALYEHRRICDCGACRTAVDLKLKFIAHVGDTEFIEIKGQKKPYGSEVIVAHRLMKNKVPLSEYLLVSNDLAGLLEPFDLQDPLFFTTLQEQYDAGDIAYHYAPLEEWREAVMLPEPAAAEDLSKHPLIVDQMVHADPHRVFEIISNMKYRELWITSAEIMHDQKGINRMGEKHICVINDASYTFQTIKPASDQHTLVYAEKTLDIPMYDQVINFYTVEPDKEGSRIRAEMHLIPSGIAGRLMRPILKFRLKRQLRDSLERIATLAESEAVS